MVNWEEIVERRLYIWLLNVVLEKKMGVNGEDYLGLWEENEKRLEEDKEGIDKLI